MKLTPLGTCVVIGLGVILAWKLLAPRASARMPGNLLTHASVTTVDVLMMILLAFVALLVLFHRGRSPPN